MTAALAEQAAARVERAWAVLAEVPDPEVPALSVCDLGIVREVRESGDALEVVLTPTYSGCPATEVIDVGREVRRQLVQIYLTATAFLLKFPDSLQV